MRGNSISERSDRSVSVDCWFDTGNLRRICDACDGGCVLTVIDRIVENNTALIGFIADRANILKSRRHPPPYEFAAVL